MVDLLHPHRVEITVETEGYKDNDDNWQPGTSSTLTTWGRWRIAANNAFIAAADGKQIAYSGTLSLPYSDYVFPLGAQVKVFDGNDLIAQGPIKQFFKYKLSRKVWL